jgi:hypothetical protein
MNPLSRFGFLLLSASAVAIILLKIFTHFGWFVGSWLYTDLTAFTVLFGFVVAISMVLVLNGALRSIYTILIVFFIVLALMYLFIDPIYLEGALVMPP